MSLTRLRDLDLDMTFAAAQLQQDDGGGDDDGGGGGAFHGMPPTPWAAPWLSQLTWLALRGVHGTHAATEDYLCRALAPGCLRALRTLEVGSGFEDAAKRRALLAACPAAALGTLTFIHPPSARRRL